MDEKESYSASLITQGDHRFFQLAMPSDVLAKCTYVTTREEDQNSGFQRVLDKKRATEIAAYIDSGLGTIPTSIVLSAQDESELSYNSKNKTLDFYPTPHAFLIIDGQHRVYGFKIAKTNVRVPVVIYTGLNRRDESKLFIDINSKQKGVPNELLLDIKKQADYESSEESLFGSLFDEMNDDISGPLFGKLSPSKRAAGRISRVTFNAAMKNVYYILKSKTKKEIFDIMSSYLIAVTSALKVLDGDDARLVQSAVFRGIVMFFVPVATKLKDRFGPDYSVENFEEIIRPAFEKVKPSRLSGSSQAKIFEHLESTLKGEFVL